MVFPMCIMMYGAALEAKTSTPAGVNWNIVNEAFSSAVRQQDIRNGGLLPTAPFHPIYRSRTPQSNSTPAPKKLPDTRPNTPLNIKTASTRKPSTGKWGWLSEIRLGALKHSAPISTNTPKEKGIDGNIEILFISPGWLDWAWSPRPHIGASFNASSEDTDQIYSGLTWEWVPYKNFFIDASFGFSGHNGRLHVDGSDENAGRQREFGCKVLFRESIEFGYRILSHHSVSLMWDHISHGGLCDDENEGMDNAGMRYGYKF